MTCIEAQEHVGGALDGTLAVNIREELMEHLALCRVCRRDFELESVSKRVVHKSLNRINTPLEVRIHVLNTLREEYTEGAKVSLFLEKWLSGRRLFPSLVAGVIVVALVYLISPKTLSPDGSSLQAGSHDVIAQSLLNFSGFREGRLKPKSVACDPTVIKSYFQKNGLQFAAETKIIEDCDWYGALHSQFEGVQLAHLMYQVGDDMTYVYEVKEGDVMEGSKLTLPTAARESLSKTGWYTDSPRTDQSVVLWTAGGTLCTAVSTMDKNRLVAFLSTP